MKKKNKKNPIQNLKEEKIMNEENVQEVDTVEETQTIQNEQVDNEQVQMNLDGETTGEVIDTVEQVHENTEEVFDKMPEPLEEPIIDEPIVDKPEEEVTEPKTIIGKIQGCSRLNVRREPSIESDVVTIIDQSCTILIDNEYINDDYYRVAVDSMIGYCAKRFVKVG